MPDGSRVAPAFLKRLKEQSSTDPHSTYDAAISALAEHPDEIALRQIQAGALLQTGSLQAAREILDRLYDAGHRDAETLGLLGSVSKRRAEAALTPEDRRAALAQARDFYLEGLERAEVRAEAEGYYPGINAAALALLLHDEAGACSLADRAAALASKTAREDYWVLATKAEAALIRRDLGTARALYTAAAGCHPSYSQLAATRRQARQITAALGLDSAVVEKTLRVPPVLVFVGHLTDSPARASARFPERMADEVAQRIRAIVARDGAAMGMSGAARGGDVLFLEALADAGVEQRIVLPLEKRIFHAASVAGSDRAWTKRFARALQRAKSLHIANSHSATADGAAFEYGTRILIGLARLHARRLDTGLRAITLWDGTPGDGHGGTAWAVRHLLDAGVPVENVYPGREGSVEAAPPNAPCSHDAGRPIRAMLFADCKGYSKLREEQVAEFTLGYLSGVARLIERLRHDGCAPLAVNTWGDGLFMAFENVRAAGTFALALREGVRRRAAELGLPKGVAVRIGLHAGPVTPLLDPITQRQNFAGQNVAYAARIEPIAPENQVCVSEAFAALAADAGLDEFRFDYLGVTPFAKGFGHYPLYQLQPAASEGD